MNKFMGEKHSGKDVGAGRILAEIISGIDVRVGVDRVEQNRRGGRAGEGLLSAGREQLLSTGEARGDRAGEFEKRDDRRAGEADFRGV